MSLTPSIFREYDIRGLVPSELNPESIALIGKAFGTHLRALDKKIISVGGDVRTHTRELMDAFIAAINWGSSAAFSSQADLPWVNMLNLLLPIVTITLDPDWKL